MIRSVGPLTQYGVISGSLDRVRAGAMSAMQVGSVTDFVDRVSESVVEVPGEMAVWSVTWRRVTRTSLRTQLDKRLIQTPLTHDPATGWIMQVQFGSFSQTQRARVT
jgi:hypothetical protein